MAQSKSGGDEHQSLSKINKFIWANTMPVVLLYGDSQLTHLKAWYEMPNDPQVAYRPTSLDIKPLDSCTWCAVPGTRFDTIHKKVCGNDIPAHQDYKGDQWGKITGTVAGKTKLNPSYIIVSLGGNDVSDFDTNRKSKYAEQQLALRNSARGYGDTSMASFNSVKYWNDEKDAIRGHVKTVYQRLGVTFPDAKIGHLEIFMRNEWEFASRRMAENIDWYVHHELGIKLLKLNDMVDHTHFKIDGVHLNNKGFHLFMDQVFTSVLNSYLQGEMVRQRRKRQEEDRQLKALARERRNPYLYQRNYYPRHYIQPQRHLNRNHQQSSHYPYHYMYPYQPY